MTHRRKAIAATLILCLAISCASQSANQTAYQTVGVTVKTVDLAMRTWAAYVVAGHTTADQETSVRAAHDHYRQTAQTMAIVLEAANTNPTPQQFAEAASAVIAPRDASADSSAGAACSNASRLS